MQQSKKGNEESKRYIRKDGYVAILTLKEKQGQKIWLLSGYKERDSSSVVKQAVNAQQATHAGQIGVSDKVGAEERVDNIPDSAFEVKAIADSINANERPQNASTDLSDVSAEDRAFLEQPMRQDPMSMARGMTTPLEDGRYVIQLFQAADLSTLAHEFAHAMFLDMQERVRNGTADAQTVAAGHVRAHEARVHGDLPERERGLKVPADRCLRRRHALYTPGKAENIWQSKLPWERTSRSTG